MLRSFITRLLSSAGDPDEDNKNPITKRTYVRHIAEDCVATIRGQSFRVMNWSFGGVEILDNDGVFLEGQPVYMTLKFKLVNRDLEVVHQGTVIRVAGRRTAIRFEPLKPHVKQGFQQVVDDAFARRHPQSMR